VLPALRRPVQRANNRLPTARNAATHGWSTGSGCQSTVLVSHMWIGGDR
jgi:hypothetical protein